MIRSGLCSANTSTASTSFSLGPARWLAACLFTLPLFALERLVRHPQSNDLFAGLITGDTGYRECLRKAAVAWLKWQLKGDSTAARICAIDMRCGARART